MRRKERKLTISSSFLRPWSAVFCAGSHDGEHYFFFLFWDLDQLFLRRRTRWRSLFLLRFCDLDQLFLRRRTQGRTLFLLHFCDLDQLFLRRRTRWRRRSRARSVRKPSKSCAPCASTSRSTTQSTRSSAPSARRSSEQSGRWEGILYSRQGYSEETHIFLLSSHWVHLSTPPPYRQLACTERRKIKRKIRDVLWSLGGV